MSHSRRQRGGDGSPRPVPALTHQRSRSWGRPQPQPRLRAGPQATPATQGTLAPWLLCDPGQVGWSSPPPVLSFPTSTEVKGLGQRHWPGEGLPGHPGSLPLAPKGATEVPPKAALNEPN